jgi:PIN domain nuclease of toxin-antitoxin system
LLLDTHVWLWWQKNDRRLGAQARRSITSAPDVYLSAASAWEIAIKASIGKLTLPRDANISAELALSGFLGLPVEVAHSEYVRQLPALHRDPFDRMLVAQARAEGLRIVTADPQLHAYGVPVLDARS